jgi:hypothetical protein
VSHPLAARRDDVDPALAAAVGFFQEAALVVVELPRPAVDR